MSRLILASGSPRRRELLGLLDIPFEVVVSEVCEDNQETDPAKLALELSRQKALAVAQRFPEAVVLAADTVVALGQDLLGKPSDAAQNLLFLQRLSGQTHQVLTGVSVWRAGDLLSEVGRSEVTFRPLTQAEMAYYAATGDGLDKAGGYGIQGQGGVLVSRLVGEYSNVVGLPLSLTVRLLRRQGLQVWGA